MNSYTPPVSALLALGRPPHIRSEIDYLALGLGPADVPELIRLLQDDELAHGDSETTEVYAQVHAWRALGQLRAVEAIEPLFELLAEQENDEDWSDWVTEDVPTALGRIGPGIIPAAVARLEQRGRQEHAPCYFANALVEVAKRFPETRTEVINQLCRVLETAAANAATVNGFVVSDLVELNAGEAWPVIERAFATGNVDETVVGDVPEVRFRLGLGPRPPQRRYDALATFQRPDGSPPAPTGSSAKQRHNERVRKKKAEKKKNKKKRH